MRLLLDSHALLWYVSADPNLSRAALAAINASEEAFVSVATHASGKLTLDQPPELFFPSQLAANGFQLLAIQPEHVFAATALPRSPEHRDPLDRVLIAQSRREGLRLVSSDIAFDAYGIDRLW